MMKAGLAVAVALSAAAGCQSAKVADPLTQTVGGNDPDQQMEFWHRLADRPATSYDEAFHAVLLFADGTDPANDYAGRVAELRKRAMLPSGFDAPADAAVDRGTLAVALARVLKVRGGVVMSLLGPSPRYATKELQYLDVYPPSSPNQTFSGAEFLAVFSRAEEYQQNPTRTARTTAAEQLEAPQAPTPEPAVPIGGNPGPGH